MLYVLLVNDVDVIMILEYLYLNDDQDDGDEIEDNSDWERSNVMDYAIL